MTAENEKQEVKAFNKYWDNDNGSEIVRAVGRKAWLARASECHSLTEEEAEKIVEPHRTWWSAINYSFMPCETVVKLLMEHSNPSPVLEEVKKFVKIMMNRERNAEAMDAYRGLLSFITSLSKGKV